MVGSKAPVDVGSLRQAVQAKYSEVATEPTKGFHFHTGRPLALRLGYSEEMLDDMPPACVESFAGVNNPFSLGAIGAGETVVDVGCGAGFDTLVAAGMVGSGGAVIGVDMTAEMLQKARHNAELAGAANVSFREGLPIADGTADVVISNGVFNLVPDKRAALGETFRVLRPGGRLYLSDIVLHKEVPDEAKENIDLWTA